MHFSTNLIITHCTLLYLIQVGCGPVAWAQVFGYYDRRAHSGSGSSASQSLYRCGTDGTTGSNSCQAPKYNDNRMKNYIGKMNDIMR